MCCVPSRTVSPGVFWASSAARLANLSPSGLPSVNRIRAEHGRGARRDRRVSGRLGELDRLPCVDFCDTGSFGDPYPLGEFGVGDRFYLRIALGFSARLPQKRNHLLDVAARCFGSQDQGLRPRTAGGGVGDELLGDRTGPVDRSGRKVVAGGPTGAAASALVVVGRCCIERELVQFGGGDRGTAAACDRGGVLELVGEYCVWPFARQREMPRLLDRLVDQHCQAAVRLARSARAACSYMTDESSG